MDSEYIHGTNIISWKSLLIDHLLYPWQWNKIWFCDFIDGSVQNQRDPSCFLINTAANVLLESCIYQLCRIMLIMFSCAVFSSLTEYGTC